MSRHDGAEGADDGLKTVVAAVLGHADEQVLGKRVHLELVASAGQTLRLHLLLHGRVGHELLEPSIKNFHQRRISPSLLPRSLLSALSIFPERKNLEYLFPDSTFSRMSICTN